MVVDAKMENNAEDLTTLSSKIFFITKTIELILAVLSLGLAVDPFSHIRETDVNHAGLAYVAYCGAIITSIVLLLSRAAREMTPVRALVLLSLTYGALLFAAGGVVLEDWRRMRTRIFLLQPKQYMDMQVASGVIAIFNGAVHFVDAVLAIKFS